jgi:hypothetical protein
MSRLTSKVESKMNSSIAQYVSACLCAALGVSFFLVDIDKGIKIALATASLARTIYSFQKANHMGEEITNLRESQVQMVETINTLNVLTQPY